jgi:hypothetical protein
MNNKISDVFFFMILFMMLVSCKKNNDMNPGPGITPAFKLSYGDSIFYLQNQATDVIIKPNSSAAGQYTGFPEGIDIDANTGAVNISKSETGLRYRVSFKPSGSTDSFSTVITISGINFLDGFYKLTTADSILKPLYNANQIPTIPGYNNGSVFDEGSNCNGSGCTVNVLNGQINLAQTVRNGVFGNKPANNDRHEFLMNYRINDKSNKSLNSLKVKLYYFDTMADVTPEAYAIIASREGTVFRADTFAPFPINGADIQNLPSAVRKTAAPRPPCIFIVSR